MNADVGLSKHSNCGHTLRFKLVGHKIQECALGKRGSINKHFPNIGFIIKKY